MSPATFFAPLSGLPSRLAGVFLLAVLVLTATPAAARQGATIHLSNGTLPIAQLAIGEDLYAALSDAPPETLVVIQLLRPDGSGLHGAYVYVDAAGNTPPVKVWEQTGVVGCDECPRARPELWLFENFAEAEDQLDGQVLTLEVVDDWTGNVLASELLPVFAPPQELAYFSNIAGCPKQDFKGGEKIYVTYRHPDLSLPQRRLFLPPAAPAWPVGQPIADARGSHQVISLPAATPGAYPAQLTYQVAGTSSLAGGGYDGIGRQPILDTPIRLTGDTVIAGRMGCGEGRIRGGIVITLEDCSNCPPVSP